MTFSLGHFLFANKIYINVHKFLVSSFLSCLSAVENLERVENMSLSRDREVQD